MSFEYIVIIAVIAVIVVFFVQKRKKTAQLAYINNYKFNDAIGKKIQEKYPHLSNKQLRLVFKALKDYFQICHGAKKKMVAMPSQVVDVAWHEFILFTRAYQTFCKKSMGSFLHHTPTEAMKSPTSAQEGIKRTWRVACANSSINPSKPKRLPLLFSIDRQLKIENGFNYSLNCEAKSSRKSKKDFCAGHIACASGCAGDSGDPTPSGFFSDHTSGDGCGSSCASCGGD